MIVLVEKTIRPELTSRISAFVNGTETGRGMSPAGSSTSSGSVIVVFCESSRPAWREPSEEVGEEGTDSEERLLSTTVCYQNISQSHN